MYDSKVGNRIDTVNINLFAAYSTVAIQASSDTTSCTKLAHLIDRPRCVHIFTSFLDQSSIYGRQAVTDALNQFN
jgi:hypothetical protein